jgi:hypothetical protein
LCRFPAGANLGPARNGFQLVESQRVDGRKSILQPTDVDAALIEVKIAIVQIEQFADAHPVTKGQQDKAIIPLSGWTLPCRLHHCLNFFGGKKTTSIHNTMLLKLICTKTAS